MTHAEPISNSEPPAERDEEPKRRATGGSSGARPVGLKLGGLTETERVFFKRRISVAFANIVHFHVYFSPSTRLIYARQARRGIEAARTAAQGSPAVPDDAQFVGTYAQPYRAGDVLDDIEVVAARDLPDVAPLGAGGGCVQTASNCVIACEPDGVSHLALIAPGDHVITPAGREVRVILVNRDAGEATVAWAANVATFKIAALRRLPHYARESEQGD